MIDAVGGSAVAAQQLQTPTQRVQAPAESQGVVGDVASPFEIAQQIQEFQTDTFKIALEAQTTILDLLV